MLILVTASDNVSTNTLMEYFMINNIFDTITQILADPSLRANHGHEAIILLIILVNYRKNELQVRYYLCFVDGPVHKMRLIYENYYGEN